MVAFVLSGSDGGDDAWCDSCDARLHERSDGSQVCSNPSCGREYLPDSVKKHKTGLHPLKDLYETDAELMPLTHFTGKKKKKPEITAYEDRYFVSKKSGLSITSSEEWLPEFFLKGSLLIIASIAKATTTRISLDGSSLYPERPQPRGIRVSRSVADTATAAVAVVASRLFRFRLNPNN
jgi:hypothetical protein